MPSFFSILRRLLPGLLLITVTGVLSPALAQGSADPAFAAAVARFDRARQGEESQIDPAIAALQALPASPALQPLQAVYLGSAYTLKGKAAWMPWNKLKLAEQGLDQIDQGLAALGPQHDRQRWQGTPLSLLTRMVAASTFVAVPDGRFHRRAAGGVLLAEIRRSPLLASTPEGFRGALDALDARFRKGEQ